MPELKQQHPFKLYFRSFSQKKFHSFITDSFQTHPHYKKITIFALIGFDLKLRH